ncbi:hypothetical protein HD554DRAFT_2168541 [Boletus coccyginus]|nr:hypothetical protein HD554DRAFT_2168541 [Boletus coccyginus]
MKIRCRLFSLFTVNRELQLRTTLTHAFTAPPAPTDDDDGGCGTGDWGPATAASVSQELTCNTSSDLSQVTLAVGKELSSKFQQTFKLPEEPQLLAVKTYKCTSSRPSSTFGIGASIVFAGTDAGGQNLPQTPIISNLEIQENQEVMVSFKLSPSHQYDNFFGDLVQGHKENIVTAPVGALIREEEQSKLAHGKKRGRKKKLASATGATATQDVPTQCAVAPSSSTTNDSVLHRMKTLESVVSQLNDRVGVLEDENRTLKLDNRRLQESNKSLEGQVRSLQGQVISLEGQVGSLQDQVRSDSKTLNALRRRIVLDQARAILVTKYALGNQTQISSSDLVEKVLSLLDNRDASLLSREALKLIFTWSAIRGKGNTAAHEASDQDISFAVLDADLTASQRQLLEHIYTFVHDITPTL